MLVQLSSREGLPETAVKARKWPFMTAVAIVSHFFISFAQSVKPEVKFYDYIRALENSVGVCW